MNRPRPLHARVLTGVSGVLPSEWNALLTPDDPPVLDWHWLAALEASGTASPARGWRPAHVALFEGASLLAVCPLYVRDTADGEFVWGGPIAQACAEAGLPFGPRGVGTIPATPVASRRLLTGPSLSRTEGVELLGQALVEVMGSEGLASVALHFCTQEEASVLARAGWIVRHQWQYHWRNAGHASFDDFLTSLKSRRRTSIRRERRELADAGVTVAIVVGADAPDAWFVEAAQLYGRTADRHDTDPLIDPSFFPRVAGSPLRDRLLLGVARDAEGICGMTFNIRDANTLFGRTWGLSRAHRFLHFEAAYYAGIDWCIEHGVGRFEPGHGGEYKRARGFRPTIVRSVHRFGDRRLHGAIHRWAGRERAWVDKRVASLGGDVTDGS